MTIPILKLSDVTSATTYRFNCGPDDIGWAFCTINDSTGELNIQSDWGSWSYGWSPNPKHLGAPTLTDFIATRSSAHYIADKLWSAGGGSAYGGGVFSAVATVKAMRARLAERRLEQGREHQRSYTDISWKRLPWWPVGEGHPLTKQCARDLWNELGELSDRHMPEVLFCERFYQLDDHEWITEESVTEYLVTETSHKYEVLRDAILPALLAACRDRLAASQRVVTAAVTLANGDS